MAPPAKSGMSAGAKWVYGVIGVFTVLIVASILVSGGDDSVQNAIPVGASQDDAAFLDAMSERGIVNDKGSQALIGTAHEICGLLGRGMTVNGLAAHYSLTLDNLSDDNMRFLIETSASAYCPQYL